jgi:hypothetical protein
VGEGDISVLVEKEDTGVNYHVVFDALQTGSQPAMCLFISLILLVPGTVGWALQRSPDPHSVLKGKIFLLISIASFGVSLVVATISSVEYHQMKLALAEGDYQVTEGIVKEFVPIPPGGPPVESFRVGGASFHYGSGWDSIVFNSAWNRRYIHNDVQVRITHQGVSILRVEIK